MQEAWLVKCEVKDNWEHWESQGSQENQNLFFY